MPEEAKPLDITEAFLSEHPRTAMKEIKVVADGYAVDKKIVDLAFPKTAIIAMIRRNNKYLTPNGSTIIESNDILIVLSDTLEAIDLVYDALKINMVDEA